MDASGVTTAVVVGLMIGIAARSIAPRRAKPPLWLTVAASAGAALLATAAVNSMRQPGSFDWFELSAQALAALVGAMVADALWGARRQS